MNGYEIIERDPLPEGKTLMELMPELRRRSEAFAAVTPQPVASVSLCRESNSIEVFLTNQAAYFGEHIPGEGGDIALYRDQATNKVVGVRLPLYAATCLIYGGGELPTLKVDLRGIDSKLEAV